MRLSKVVSTVCALVFGVAIASAGSVCPAGSGSNPFPHSPDNANTGCNVLITVNANGTVTVSVQDSTPYETSEDVLVGVVNKSATNFGSLTLTGPSIFGFDGDGICVYTFVGSSYCTSSQMNGTDPGDYAGPTSTFSGITNGGNTGTVTFAGGVPPNGSTYFSLEGVPTAGLTVTVGAPSGGGGGTLTVPTLSSVGLFLLGISLVGLAAWKLRASESFQG